MKRIEDERIISEKRRINSSAFGICFLALWAILLFRQFVQQQNIMEYIDIYLLTIGISIYVTINNVSKGFYLTYRSKDIKKKINLIGAAVGTVVFTLIQFFMLKYDLKSLEDVIKIIVSVIVFFVIFITSQSILLRISEKKADKDTE